MITPVLRTSVAGLDSKKTGMGARDTGALAERRRQEQREQRERERYRPYPSQNLTGSRRGRLREQGQRRRAVSWSQRDRQDRDQERGRVQQRGRARERGGRQSQGGRRREHNRDRTDVGASRRPGLPSHVQQVVQMGAETVSAPSRSERVPSPPSVRRVYVDEPSQVVRASFSQLRGFGGTLPSHEQMIGGPSTSTSVDEPSQVIKVSFTKLQGYGGRPPSHKQMIGGRKLHPKIVDVPINWEEMDTLFWSAECVGIGECGLDRTRPHPEQQRQVFRRQVLAAKLTGKPLVLHLRGDTPQQDDEVYMEALDILTKECLPRRHPVYLHCFVASWKVYMAWAHRYNNLLLGITSKSVQAPDFGKVAHSLPFERLALESDAPHMCPFQGHVNHPLLIHYQAGVVARIRNMPSLIVLSGAGINVRRFFRL